MIDWIDVGRIADVPQRGSRTIELDGERLALFRTHDDRIFALVDRCPHKGGPLSQGIIHGHAVACPLHNMRIALATGTALGGDSGCTPVIPVRMQGDRILLGRQRALAAAA